jgi:hypothetical protein
MTKAHSTQLKAVQKNGRNLSRIIVAAILFLGMGALSSEVFAATRTPIPRKQASDNILLCRATGGEIIRTPSVVACCNENSDGTTTCVGCAPDGTHCANYSVRTGNKSSLRRLLMQSAPSSGKITAPKLSNPRIK